MQPDEILRMDNRQCLVLLRGQKPILLYKIIPDEFASFRKLRPTPVREYTPVWRELEARKPQEPSTPPLTSPSTVPSAPPAAASRRPPAMQRNHAVQKPSADEPQYEYNLFSLETELGMVEKSLDAVRGEETK